MSSTSKSNSNWTGRQQSPTFKTTLGPMDHALLAAETKSDLSLVMDVTKEEDVTTQIVVRRDRAGKLRYSIRKDSKCNMKGVMGSSPSVCKRIREDSLAKEYIPEIGSSKRRRQKKRSCRSRKKKPTSKDSNATGKSSTTSNVDQDEPAGPKDSKPKSGKTSKSEKKRKRREKQKKRLEIIREQNQTRSNEIVFKNPDETTREPVTGDNPTSVKDDDLTSPVRTNATPNKAEPHKALQESGESVELKQDQEQSAASPKCSTKSSLLQYVTPALDAKSPPASPTSKVFCIPPNAEAIKTPSPPGKRAQAKESPPASPAKQITPTEKYPTSVDGLSTLTKFSLDLASLKKSIQGKQAMSSGDANKLKVQSVDTWKSFKSKLSIPKSKTNSTKSKVKESVTASLSKQQPLGRSVKSLDAIQQSDKSKHEEKDAPTKTKLTTPESAAPKESIAESQPPKVLSSIVSTTPIGKTGQLLSQQAQDSVLMFLTPVPGKSPAASLTSKIFAIPPNADKIKTPSPPGKSQKETGTLLPLVAPSGTPKTQQLKEPKSPQSLKSLKSNPSVRIQKDDLKEPTPLINVKEKVLTPKEMTPKSDDHKKVQAIELVHDVRKAPENTDCSMQAPVKEQPLTSPKQEALLGAEPKHSPIGGANKVIETPKALPENAVVAAVGSLDKSTPKATPKKDSSDEEPKKDTVLVDTSLAEEQRDISKEVEDKSKLVPAQISTQEVSKAIGTPKSQPKQTTENADVVAKVSPFGKSTPTGKSFEPKKDGVVAKVEPRDMDAKENESKPKPGSKTILITEEQMSDLKKTPRSKSPEINTPDSAVYSIPTEELQNMIAKQEDSLELKSPAKPVSQSTSDKKSFGTPSKVQQMVRALESLKPKSKQPNDKQIGSEEAGKDLQSELKITSEKIPSKSTDETTSAPVQSEIPKEEVPSEPPKDKTSVTKVPKEEHSVSTAEVSQKQQPKKTEHEGTPKADSEVSRNTPTPTPKPQSEEPDVIKLQSSMTAFNQKPEAVGAPFEIVQVQPSDEKVPHSASNIPLLRAIDIEQAEHPEKMAAAMPFKLEPDLEALRLLDDEPSIKKAKDIQPEADQVELQEKPSSPQSAAPVPPNQLDPHLKFYYHQEANLRSMQTCYGNEISGAGSTAEPIKSESELIARQEILMHEGDAFVEQVKSAPAKPSVTAAPSTGPLAGGNQVQPAQAIGSKAKVLMAMAAVASLFIAAYVANII